MKRVVMFSGGIGSWAAAKRVAAAHGTADMVLLFADTLIEDEDLYRFLDEAAANVGVPLTRIAEGRTPWQVFKDERYIGNSRVDPCSKILKRGQIDKWRNENCDPADTTVYVGLSWDEEHRFTRLLPRVAPWKYEAPMCEAPYLDKPAVLAWAKSEGLRPPRLYEMGFPHNNCLSGDTRFVTDEGIKTLGETVGQKVIVLGSRAAWHNASVQSFGKQRLMRVELQRYSETKIVYATAGHRWLRRTRPHRTERTSVITTDLRPDDWLVSMYSRIEPAVRPSAYGIAHGIVFGAGTRTDAETSWNNPARVMLCGEKNAQLLRWFPLSPQQAAPDGIEVRDLPRTWKEPPSIAESKSYLYGWLAGYFAADGTVTGGQIRLCSARREHLEFAAGVAAKLGIGTCAISSKMRSGFGRPPTALYTLVLLPSTLREDFFLIAQHRERYVGKKRSRPADFRVVSVESTDRTEEVFCAVVPEGHEFTLEGNLLTGNCGGFCIKAGQAQFALLLRTMPERYAAHEAEEEALRAYLNKDVSIMRDRRGGTSKTLTMQAFRERIEKDDFDKFEWGGCGCAID